MEVDRVLLWGFMACGKTVVGAQLARRLGWRHLDFDREIVRRAGCSIAEIFQRSGEAEFRRMEAEVTRDLLSRHRTVFSTGGGWVTNPGLLDAIPPRTLSVWLRVTPETALARAGREGSGIVRPLLRTPDPAATIQRLMAEREPLYARAACSVSTDGRPVDAVVTDIVACLRGAHPATERTSEAHDA